MSDNNQTYKADSGKTRLDLVSPTFIEAVGKIRTFGVQKYGDGDSWKKVEPQRYMAALLRHINAYRMGEEIDKESGMSHLWHAACNLMFLIDLDERKDTKRICGNCGLYKDGECRLYACVVEDENDTCSRHTYCKSSLFDKKDTPPKENKCCLNCLLYGECEDFRTKTVVNGCCDKWQSDRVQETKAAITALPDTPQDDIVKPKRTCKTCYLYVDEKCQLNGYECLDGYVCKHYAWKGK
jgi:hypothetical protein